MDRMISPPVGLAIGCDSLSTLMSSCSEFTSKYQMVHGSKSFLYRVYRITVERIPNFRNDYFVTRDLSMFSVATYLRTLIL